MIIFHSPLLYQYFGFFKSSEYFPVKQFISELTIKGFNMIMDGEVDKYPEAAFNLVGTIEDAIAKGDKILAES